MKLHVFVSSLLFGLLAWAALIAFVWLVSIPLSWVVR